MNHSLGRGFLYGVGAVGGYGTSQTASMAASGGPLSVVQPFVGFVQDGQRASLMFQYSPAIDIYDSRRWDGGVFHRASLDGSYLLSPRWAWLFSGGTTYGAESARELATFSVTADNSTGLLLLNPASMVIHNLTENLLTIRAATSLAWQRTARQRFLFSVSDAYGSYSGDAWSSSTITERAEMEDRVSPVVELDTYAQAHTYTESGCSDAGGGLGVRVEPTQKTSIGLEAGPQFGQSSCGTRVRADFSGSLQHLFTPTTTAYIRATRELGVTLLAGTEWVDDFSAGVQKQTSPTTLVELQGGYLRSTGVVAGANGLYNGYFISPEVRWRTSPTIEVIGSYRYYQQNGVGGQYRSWIMCTLQWQPSTRALSKLHPLEK